MAVHVERGENSETRRRCTDAWVSVHLGSPRSLRMGTGSRSRHGTNGESTSSETPLGHWAPRRTSRWLPPWSASVTSTGATCRGPGGEFWDDAAARPRSGKSAGNLWSRARLRPDAPGGQEGPGRSMRRRTRGCARSERPQYSHGALGGVGERMGDERVVTRLTQPYLEDAPTAHRDVDGLHADQRVRL